MNKQRCRLELMKQPRYEEQNLNVITGCSWIFSCAVPVVLIPVIESSLYIMNVDIIPKFLSESVQKYAEI